MTAIPRRQILTPAAVSSLMIACLSDEGAPGWRIEAIEGSYDFSLEAVQDNVPAIQRLLAELPDEFRDTNEKAGAWSFLNAVDDRHGNRWAPDHLHVEALIALGLAVNLVEWTRPREDWPNLPGGFPFVTVLASKFVPAARP